MLRAGFDYNYQSLEQYIKDAHHYLTDQWHLLLGTGSFARLDQIELIASRETILNFV